MLAALSRANRAIDGIELKEHPLSDPDDGVVWWDAPAD
jgi:hypothetical protein